MKRSVMLPVLFILIAVLSGCRIIVVEDHYSLDSIPGEITCEYRVGRNAMYSEDHVDTDVGFDKEMFLKLFHEYNQYDPNKIMNKPGQCDLKINADEQPDEWLAVQESEFNVKAVFGDDYRSVSIYRYEDKLYYFVLCMGGGAEPEMQGEYYMELSEEMSGYWRTIIEAVESSL